MKIRVDTFTERPLCGWGDPVPVYEAGGKPYTLGRNLVPSQIEDREGGIQNGGETFLHVKGNGSY